MAALSRWQASQHSQEQGQTSFTSWMLWTLIALNFISGSEEEGEDSEATSSQSFVPIGAADNDSPFLKQGLALNTETGKDSTMADPEYNGCTQIAISNIQSLLFWRLCSGRTKTLGMSSEVRVKDYVSLWWAFDCHATSNVVQNNLQSWLVKLVHLWGMVLISHLTKPHYSLFAC